MPDFTQMPAHLAQALLAREAAALRAFPTVARPTPPKPTLGDARRLLVAANPDAQGRRSPGSTDQPSASIATDKVRPLLVRHRQGHSPRLPFTQHVVLTRNSKGTDLR